LLVQQFNHRAASFLAQVILSWNEFDFHKPNAKCQCNGLETGSASQESVGICATPG
jgi:hypothetical protein